MIGVDEQKLVAAQKAFLKEQGLGEMNGATLCAFIASISLLYTDGDSVAAKAVLESAKTLTDFMDRT